ncbi:MAG: plasmid pRiA4b ORF-3 family protein [Bryobacteraceae bacterium]
MRKAAPPLEIYQIKVTLLGTKPPIWRRVLVPKTITLEQLHDVLQLAMGWYDCHLHEFRAGHDRFGAPDPDDEPMGMPAAKDERKVPVSRVLARAGAKMSYTYDFGDTWEHAILLEKRLPADASVHYPVCIGGKRACPPEDCGGIYGFYNLLEILGDPEHEEHEEMLEWAGEFDPEAFSVDEVNQKFGPRRGWSRSKRRSV